MLKDILAVNFEYSQVPTNRDHHWRSEHFSKEEPEKNTLSNRKRDRSILPTSQINRLKLRDVYDFFEDAQLTAEIRQNPAL